MRWAEIEGGVWTIPAERAKSGQARALPLARQTLALVADLPRPRRSPVQRRPRRLPVWCADKQRLDAALRFDTAWSLHDLRRTIETRMAEPASRRTSSTTFSVMRCTAWRGATTITLRTREGERPATLGRSARAIVTGGGGEVIQLRAR